MSFTDYSLEPLSSLSSTSNVFDFDQENLCEHPIYASLSTVPSFSTPPRSFGTDITALSNNHYGQFLLDSFSNVARRNDFDFGPLPLNGQTPPSPYCHQICPTLTSCMIGSNGTHNGGPPSLQSILDSPTSSRSFDSTFSFPEPNVLQIESSLFDSDDGFAPLVINEEASSVLSGQEEQNSTPPNNDVRVKIEDDTESSERPIKIENHDYPVSMYASIPTCGYNQALTQSGNYNDYGNQAVVKSEPHDHDMDRAKAKKIFPYRLHDLASDENFEPLSWSADGTMLVVNMQTINRHLMKICRTKKFASFLRQLHLYGFRKDARCMPNKRIAIKVAYYYHKFFLREFPEQLHKINRVKL